jgi:hypothetical protein
MIDVTEISTLFFVPMLTYTLLSIFGLFTILVIETQNNMLFTDNYFDFIESLSMGTSYFLGYLSGVISTTLFMLPTFIFLQHLITDRIILNIVITLALILGLMIIPLLFNIILIPKSEPLINDRYYFNSYHFILKFYCYILDNICSFGFIFMYRTLYIIESIIIVIVQLIIYRKFLVFALSKYVNFGVSNNRY